MLTGRVLPYHYVKDAIGNVIAILNGDAEVAHYEYDAWGNCTITKDIDGIATLNPIRWKSQYYDQESGLYLLPTFSGSRYYSPVMKSFISSCIINEILYNIDVPGNFNPYIIGNPLYFLVNSYNYSSVVLKGDSVYDIEFNRSSFNLTPLPNWTQQISIGLDIVSSLGGVLDAYLVTSWLKNNSSYIYGMPRNAATELLEYSTPIGKVAQGLGYALIVFDVFIHVYNNMASGASWQRTAASGITTFGKDLAVMYGVGKVGAPGYLIL